MESLERILGPGGPLAARLPNYEVRPQQIELAEAVARAVTEGQVLLAEAGTGCGKSFAYAIPFLLWANELRGQRKVAFSTYTKALQQQLASKDLPLLLEALGLDLKVEVVMGIENYICMRRFTQRMDFLRQTGLESLDNDLNEAFGAPRTDELRKVEKWIKAGGSGNLEDCAFRLSPATRAAISHTRYACAYPQCPHQRDCVWMDMKRAVAKADVIVANHHIFLLESEGNQLLPRCDGVVFDEGQALEDAASAVLGERLSQHFVTSLLRGLLASQGPLGLASDLPQGEVEITRNQIQFVLEETRAFFQAVRGYVWTRYGGSEEVRLQEPLAVQDTLAGPLEDLAASLQDLAGHTSRQEASVELAGAAKALLGVQAGLSTIITVSQPDHVYWLESEQRAEADVALNSAPVEPGQALAERIFEQYAPAVVTSATLRVGGSFEFVRNRIGAHEAVELSVSSPFDYSSRCKLYLPPSMPDPGRQAHDYEARLLPLIGELLEVSRGRAFVLFTSYRQMEAAATWLQDEGFDDKYGLLVQGDLPRHELLERFRGTPGSVLLGTRTFWQGVDVPGEALVAVIIAKLPFQVPDEPLVQARCQAIERRGGNPFMEYSVPTAAMALRQAFGRLIRTREDYGLVAVLDPRLRTKRYGEFFLESLPDCPVTSDIDELREAFALWENLPAGATRQGAG